MANQPRFSSVRSVALRSEKYLEEAGRTFRWRHPDASRFEQVVSEVLLQQTRAETVGSFFPVFLQRFPDWNALAETSEDEIGEVIRPLGIWRRRAKSLRNLAKAITARGGEFPQTRVELEALPAVGQYVANAVELFCHGKPRPLLDAGMARVLERYFGPRDLADIRYDTYLQKLAARVVEVGTPWKVNWGILDIASAFCRPRNPACTGCPLRRGCRHAPNIS